jgi:hypothetical protein
MHSSLVILFIMLQIYDVTYSKNETLGEGNQANIYLRSHDTLPCKTFGSCGDIVVRARDPERARTRNSSAERGKANGGEKCECAERRWTVLMSRRSAERLVKAKAKRRAAGDSKAYGGWWRGRAVG